jgi:dynein heavy chain 2
MEIINQLPDSDNPGLFQLPLNIDRALQRTNSQKVINSLKILTSTTDTGLRFNRERWSTELSPFIQLWQKLISGNNNIVDGKITTKPDSSPIESFVYMENQKAHRLAKIVNHALQSLSKVISGSALLTPSIFGIGTSLLRGAVPGSWMDEWEGPEDPYSWLRGLVSRVIALDSWVEKVNNGTLLKGSIDLGELFRPDTFINALRQQTARLTKVPVDRLKLTSAPDARALSNCRLPVTLTGLQLQGCGFDGGRILESPADGPSLVTIDTFTIGWISQEEADPFPASNVVGTPVYYASNRERYISEFMLPCSGDKSKWILAGIAISLCE